MTCRDCIHDGVCHIQEMSTDLEMEEYLKEFGCEDFKNKADFVEVVRCEKCKYLEHTSNHIPYCKRMDAYSDGDILYEVCYDDFCSYGLKGEKL